MTKFFGLFVAVAAFLAAPAYSQCPSCEGENLECPLTFDGTHVVIRTFNQFACRASTTANYGETKYGSCTKTFEPPFMLVSPIVSEISSNNGSFSITTLAKNTDIKFEEEIKTAYKSVKEVAAKYNDTAAQAKLDQMMDNHIKWMKTLQTSHPTIEVKVEASGHGWELDRKRGWQDTAAYARVACVLPANLKDQLLTQLGLKSDQVAIKNSTGKAVYAYQAHTDTPSASCSSIKGGTLIRYNTNQSEIYTLPVANGQAGKLCVSFYNTRPEPKERSFAKSCEYSPGPINDIASLPAQCTN